MDETKKKKLASIAVFCVVDRMQIAAIMSHELELEKWKKNCTDHVADCAEHVANCAKHATNCTEHVANCTDHVALSMLQIASRITQPRALATSNGNKYESGIGIFSRTRKRPLTAIAVVGQLCRSGSAAAAWRRFSSGAATAATFSMNE